MGTSASCDLVDGWALSEQELVRELVLARGRAMEWLARPEKEREASGYLHTFREILQQPATWLETCERAVAHTEALRLAIEGARAVVLTGSGSSEYAGECVRFALQKELDAVAVTAGGGDLLADSNAVIPPVRPALMVSLARSGDSPESLGALEAVRKREPAIRQLVITCNRAGGLALACAGAPAVHVLTLDDRTNDRSLVMTSSFTNVVLAAGYLSMLDAPEHYRQICRRLSGICRALLLGYFDRLIEIVERPFDRVVFLGFGAAWGAARESALKMLEMTAGRIAAMSETYLGFRHGPMSFAGDKTLLVCYLSSDPVRRAYESDLIHELHRKDLGLANVIVGENIPETLVRPRDAAIELAGLGEIGDDHAPVIQVVVGQLLAFGRCMAEGLHPDSPSQNGVIQRVVDSFPLYLMD